MKTQILTFVILIMTAYKSFSQTNNIQSNNLTNNTMNTIVLVHGAWADASAWDKVVPFLKDAGNEVITVNLPGHGKDNTPNDKLSLQAYVDAVKNAIGTRTNIILAGHSMGGMIISQTAEQIPSQISKLIYVTAFVPMEGESLLSLANQDKESLLGKYLKPDEKTGTGSFEGGNFIEFFAADVSPETADDLVSNFKPEFLGPFDTKASVSESNFGGIKKIYIHAVDDKAIGFKLQKQMAKNAGITVTYSLNTSHVPYLSMPKELSEIIIKEAE